MTEIQQTKIVLTEQDVIDAIKNNDARQLVKHVEYVVCMKALEITRGNMSAAATLISMSRSKFRDVVTGAKNLNKEGEDEN